MKRTSRFLAVVLLVLVAVPVTLVSAQDDGGYKAPEPAFDPVPLAEGAQADCAALNWTPGDTVRIAYMPPATEFNYYQAIGAGIEQKAEELGVETFMLAPQSGSDIAGQMGMIQDVLTQEVDAIILSTHDENAAAPLVEQAVEAGVAVIIINSDIANFPSPVHGVVGYSQRGGTSTWATVPRGAPRCSQVGVWKGCPAIFRAHRWLPRRFCLLPADGSGRRADRVERRNRQHCHGGYAPG